MQQQLLKKDKSYLKPSVSETEIVVTSDGEVLGRNIKQHKYLAETKEQFFIGYVSMLALFYEELSGPEIKVYAYLLAHYNFDSTIAIVKGVKQEMIQKIGGSTRTIDNALCKLTEKRLLYSTARAIYKLNPRYAFKGSTGERNRLLKVILEMECPDC
jgi:hypothetical protein